MKTIKQSMVMAVALSLMTSINVAHAHGVSQAKAAELGLHRIERLVILKKIEEAFQSKPQSLKLELLPHDTEDQPSFKVTVSQYPAADATLKSVEIVLNEEGKALSHLVIAGSDAVGAPTWPDKDATTICENALHKVIDGSTSDAALVPYRDGLSRYTLSQGTDSAGATVAVVDIETTVTEPILRIRINLDGTFNTYELVPRVQPSPSPSANP